MSRSDRNKLEHGRAVISGHLGGAKLAWQIDALVTRLADDNGRPPRSRPDAWPDGLAEALADVDSLSERNAMQESTIVTLEGLKRTAQNESARARIGERDAKAALDEATQSALLFGAEADELRNVLEPLAAILASLPLAVLASAEDAGKLAALYLRAEVITSETPAERYERIRRKLAGEDESGEEESGEEESGNALYA